MSWSGGTYTKGNNATGGWTGDASLGIGIEAGRHDTQDNDFATGINNCIAKDGQNAATADLPMGGFKHTNVANATARNNYAAVGQVQDGDFIWLGTTGGTATAQTATATPAITAYKAGQKFRMKIGSGLGSTGTVRTSHTININSIGAKNIKRASGNNPTIGDWVAGAIMEVIYDGTDFIVTNDPGGWLTYTVTITPTAGTASSVVSTWNHFRKQDGIVYLNTSTTWTQNTAPAGAINVSLPVRAFGHSQVLFSYLGGGSGFGIITSPTSNETVRVYIYNQSSISTGAGQIVAVNAYYYSE